MLFKIKVSKLQSIHPLGLLKRNILDNVVHFEGLEKALDFVRGKNKLNE